MCGGVSYSGITHPFFSFSLSFTMASGPSQVNSPEMVNIPVLCFLRIVAMFVTLLEDTGLNTNGME